MQSTEPWWKEAPCEEFTSSSATMHIVGMHESSNLGNLKTKYRQMRLSKKPFGMRSQLCNTFCHPKEAPVKTVHTVYKTLAAKIQEWDTHINMNPRTFLSFLL